MDGHIETLPFPNDVSSGLLIRDSYTPQYYKIDVEANFSRTKSRLTVKAYDSNSREIRYTPLTMMVNLKEDRFDSLDEMDAYYQDPINYQIYQLRYLPTPKDQNEVYLDHGYRIDSLDQRENLSEEELKALTGDALGPPAKINWLRLFLSYQSGRIIPAELNWQIGKEGIDFSQMPSLSAASIYANPLAPFA